MQMVEELTERQKELLEALKSANDWTGRGALATATGKNRLSPHDFLLLERLEAAGLIEIRKRSTGTINPAYEYKAK